MNKLLIKKIAFFSLVSVFLIVAPFLILDAQGYGFDFKKREFVKLGGISIKSIIPDVNVFINNEYKNKTAPFSKDLLIQKLIPEEYNIRVEKENYHSWSKTLRVEGQKVTKAENIYLFPENNPINQYKDNINNFFLSKNKQNIVYLTNNQEIIYNNSTILKETESKKYFSSIEDIKFFPDLKNILIKGKNLQNKTTYYYLSLDTLILNNLNFLESANNFYLKENSIVYQNKNNIIEYSLSTKKSPVLRTSVDVFAMENDTIYSVENNILIKIDNKKETILSEKEITIIDYSLLITSGKIFAQDASSLYLFNENKKEFEFFLKTKDISYDVLPDKIIFNTGSELWLLLLKDFETPFFKKSGSLIFLSRFSSEIKNLAWFNDDYFFYSINKNVFVSEIDNRDNINTFQLSPLPIEKIWFNKKILYVLSDGKMYNSNEFNP
ncbi:MAG: hypothetical protein MCSN_4720 [Candidatus Microsyncoccus archaeolyticus]|nr:MAG: hypothetical protein MCSN_4720 [Candidatus Parcubacteria bacterium]